MLNMRVKTLGYKFVGVDRKEIKLFKWQQDKYKAPNSCHKQMIETSL